MNADEFGDLAALWNAPARAAELSELEQIARKTPARARLVQASELALAAIVAICVAAAMMWRAAPATLFVGSSFLLLLGWSAWSRHRLADLALLVDRSDRSTFLSSVIRAKEAELRRSAIGLALMLPAVLLVMVLSYLVQSVGQQATSFAEFMPEVMLTLRGGIALVVLAGAICLLTVSHLRLIGELARLHELARDYAEEMRLDGADGM